MKPQKDSAWKAKKHYKNQAILFVKVWIESDVARYPEPSRAGTPKGQPIGLSRKKYETALVMVLHPALKLKEIAEIAGVSEGVLKVWQTQGPFKQAVSSGCKAVGFLISEIIRTIMLESRPIVEINSNGKKIDSNGIYWSDKATREYYLHIKKLCKDPVDLAASLIKILPFLNPLASIPVIESIEKHFNLLDPDHMQIALTAHHAPAAYSMKSVRKWKKKPEVLELTKKIITSAIIHLVEDRTEGDEEAVQKAAKGLNEFICKEIDFLAS